MTVDDRPALAAILQDPTVMTAYEGAFSDAEVDAWLSRTLERYECDGHGFWAVVPRGGDEMIGQCGITWQDQAGTQVLEVGYLFRRQWWGRGFATEAARACVNWAFSELDPEWVYAHVRDTNTASMNVAIRLGMTVRSRFTKYYRGVEMPHFAFGVDRTRWMAADCNGRMFHVKHSP